MKNLLTPITLSLIIALSVINTPVLQAEELDNKVNSNVESNSQENNNGGFLKLGYGYKIEISPYAEEVNKFSLFVNGRYQWQGLFVEAFYGANKRNEGLSIGYNFYNTEHWNFDINTIKAHGEINAVILDGDKLLNQQFSDTEMIGFRATGNFEQATVQFMLAPYSFNNDYNGAVFASMWLGKSWQVKNWEFNANIGFEYRSEKMLDHYYGISAEEATEHFGSYQADAGIDVTAQASVSYPITRDVLFESYVNYTDFSSSIDNSPIMSFVGQLDGRSKNRSEAGILVSYVF